MKGYVLDYINENEYKKLERSLKKYNMLAFKKLTFSFYHSLKDGVFLGVKTSSNKKNNTESYELTLPSSDMFAKMYGNVTVKYIVYKNEKIVMLDTITPTKILLEGHRSELTTYKGIMISKENASKEMFKIDLLNMLNEDK